ncbi:MAG: hypothetical protein IT210_06620 [Armatimonadetes bacterium]|nr:hypothetical protein [Armatimonadota bacterium]
MPLTINLTFDEEMRLQAAARKEGLVPEEMARRLLTTHLPPGLESEANASSIALLRSWLEEDATENPEEIASAEEELRAFKEAVNAERDSLGARRVYP